MDILNSDLQLKMEATSKRSRSGKNRHDEFENDAGFHFIAFVPALGKVWKFDGLERQPQALGEYASICADGGHELTTTQRNMRPTRTG
jgi:ubiquitin carboxyl-terminal hydrolase L5